MYYHRCMAYRMVQRYEAAQNMRFDWVVLVRLDAQWLDPVLPIEAYANDRVWLTETVGCLNRSLLSVYLPIIVNMRNASGLRPSQ